MDQQLFKVSFSVGTRLLVSIVLLLMTIILFLNISTIFLFREDKLAYTYQSQSNNAVLAGREFLITSKHALDTLRISLATVDPRTPITPLQTSMLQSIINNQTEVLSSSVYLVNIKEGTSKLHSRASKEKEVKEQVIQLDSYQVKPDWMKQVLPELLQNAFAFVNLSKLGDLPVLAVLFADLKLKDHPAGMPVAVGLVSLKGFGSELNNMKLTIASRAGWVLYDTDPTVFFSKENIADNPLFQTAAASHLASGAQEYEFNGTHYLGSFVLPGLNLVVLTNIEWQKAMKATYMLIEKFILLGSMAVGAAVIFAILFSKTLTAPLGQLYEATKEVSKGNFQIELEEKGRDEIGALSKSFNAMSRKINDLIQESMAKVHLENELAIASTVQQTLIPPEEFHSPLIHIFSHYQSASECGGDWWGFFGVGNKIALMIADATGHGLPCALITASARSCFSVMHKLAQEDPEFSFSPSAMLSYANRVIYDASVGKIMMTFFIGVIDFDTQTLTYSSAAHNPPWLFKKESGGYVLKSLTAVGQRLGEVRDAPPFEEKSVSVQPSDILFLYTDGLIEGKSVQGDMYSKKRARKLLEQHVHTGPNQLIATLMNDFLKHNEGKPLDDDVTLAAALILPPGQSGKTNA
jgi:sigma-B regulation protein RsbU (phosphoserine phosphatase)